MAIEITQKIIIDRIKVLEAEIEKVSDQVAYLAKMRVSMQGGVIELKKLLKGAKGESNKITEANERTD